VDFDALCDRLISLYDVGQTRAVDVANERLALMLGQAKSLRKLVTIGTTVADQHTYALDASIVEVRRVTVAFTAGTVTYTGTESIDALLDLASGDAVDPSGCGKWYAVQADTDGTMTTDNLYLYPAPDEAGASIVGVCAILPATITYGSSTALPIPVDVHKDLLAGCKAELSDEESRQDEAAKWEAVFASGIVKLAARQKSRGQGSDRHRMRLAGYDMRRG
jgi:hypothetical protein